MKGRLCFGWFKACEVAEVSGPVTCNLPNSAAANGESCHDANMKTSLCLFLNFHDLCRS